MTDIKGDKFDIKITGYSTLQTIICLPGSQEPC